MTILKPIIIELARYNNLIEIPMDKEHKKLSEVGLFRADGYYLLYFINLADDVSELEKIFNVMNPRRNERSVQNYLSRIFKDLLGMVDDSIAEVIMMDTINLFLPEKEQFPTVTAAHHSSKGNAQYLYSFAKQLSNMIFMHNEEVSQGQIEDKSFYAMVFSSVGDFDGDISYGIHPGVFNKIVFFDIFSIKEFTCFGTL